MRPVIGYHNRYPAAELSTYRYQPESFPSHDPNYPYLDVYPNIYHPYDPITGEYIKPLQPLERNLSQSLVTTGYNSYDNESDSVLLCCDCWRFRIPVNCLTLSLFINLVLLVLFTLIKFHLIDPKNTSKNTGALIEEIIFILLFTAVVILILILIRYTCSHNRRQQFLSVINCRAEEEEVENRETNRNNLNNYSYNCSEEFV
jgi:hypothetical protein